MVKWGFPEVSIYPNTGIMLELRGDIEIHGRCDIGNASYISTGPRSHIEFGDRFRASAAAKIVCYERITFGYATRIGWECMFMDTDFHRMTRDDGKPVRAYGPIAIGSYNWFGNGCLVLKNTRTSEKSTIAARTVLSRDYSTLPEKSVIGERKNLQALRTGIWRDIDDDAVIMEYSHEQSS